MLFSNRSVQLKQKTTKQGPSILRGEGDNDRERKRKRKRSRRSFGSPCKELVGLLELRLSEDGEIEGASNGKDILTEEVHHVGSSPGSSDPCASEAKSAREDEREDESRDKNNHGGLGDDRLVSKPVESDAAGMDQGRGNDDNLEGSDGLVLRKKEEPSDGNDRVASDGDEQLGEDAPVTLGEHTRKGLVALGDGDGADHAASDDATKSDGWEGCDGGDLPELDSGESSDEIDQHEGKLGLCDAAAVVELHDEDLGALPVDDDKAEGSVDDAHVLKSSRLEAKAMAEEAARRHDADRVHHMIKEVTQGGAGAKTTSMLAVNSIHGLEEELGEGSENHKPRGKAFIARLGRIEHAQNPAHNKGSCSTNSNDIGRDPIGNKTGNPRPHLVQLMCNN